MLWAREAPGCGFAQGIVAPRRCETQTGAKDAEDRYSGGDRDEVIAQGLANSLVRLNQRLSAARGLGTLA